MPDQPSDSKHADEPPRGRSIPADFIWDPEGQCWYPPGEGSDWDPETWRRDFEARYPEDKYGGPAGLISADHLRALGAFDFPPGWRKSLSAGTKSAPQKQQQQRDLFSDLVDDDDDEREDARAEAPDEDEMSDEDADSSE